MTSSPDAELRDAVRATVGAAVGHTLRNPPPVPRRPARPPPRRPLPPWVRRLAIAVAGAALGASCPLWPPGVQPICRAVASAVSSVGAELGSLEVSDAAAP